MSLSDRDRLVAAVREFRAAAERAASGTDDVVFRKFPVGCCKLSALLLARFLYERGFGKAHYVWGDRAKGPGEADTHGWLTLGSLIIDITGDQFSDGPSPVLIAERSEWHDRFRPHNRFSYDDMMQFNDDFALRFATLYTAVVDVAPPNEATGAS